MSAPYDPAESERIRQAVYASMSPEEKWAEVNRLRELAVQLKTAALRLQHPDWADEDLQEAVRKIFLYAHS